jgi:hypothetical protein
MSHLPRYHAATYLKKEKSRYVYAKSSLQGMSAKARHENADLQCEAAVRRGIGFLVKQAVVDFYEGSFSHDPQKAFLWIPTCLLVLHYRTGTPLPMVTTVEASRSVTRAFCVTFDATKHIHSHE